VAEEVTTVAETDGLADSHVRCGPTTSAWSGRTLISECAGRVLWHLTRSLDGFIAGPHYEMGSMTGLHFAPRLVDRYVAGTGAILAGRRGFDAGLDADPEYAVPYAGAWSGPIFVLTHDPEDACACGS
jgi:hypothetical protein